MLVRCQQCIAESTKHAGMDVDVDDLHFCIFDMSLLLSLLVYTAYMLYSLVANILDTLTHSILLRRP